MTDVIDIRDTILMTLPCGTHVAASDNNERWYVHEKSWRAPGLDETLSFLGKVTHRGTLDLDHWTPVSEFLSAYKYS